MILFYSYPVIMNREKIITGVLKTPILSGLWPLCKVVSMKIPNGYKAILENNGKSRFFYVSNENILTDQISISYISFDILYIM